MNDRKPIETADTMALTPGDGPRASFEPAPPVVAGRYDVIGLLGAGGMGAVYRVRDRELDEIVALKMLRPEWSRDAAALERFRSEVRLARRVTHTNVARTFDIGEHEGERFLTMECVDGGSLASRLADEGPLPARDVIAITEAICAGLSAAHGAGVVHRDLKPENVLLAKDGRVVVTDFGIAFGGNTADGAIMGTPAYMAPEQLVPGAAVDNRADLYALGAVVFEMTTGARAWGADGLVAILAERAGSAGPPDPSRIRPEAGPFADVVARCMAVSPAARFTSAADVARALPRGGEIARTRVSSPPPAMPRPSRAGKTVAVLPFGNEGPEDDAYIAEGLAADLIDTLSMTRGLQVRTRGAVARFAGTSASPEEIGRALSVQVVVEGAIRRVGDRVRVRMRAISTDDAFQLFARRFEAPVGELLAATDEAAHAIAAALTAELPAMRAAPAQDTAAVELYLRARQEFAKYWSQSAKSAVELYERALALSPDDPRIVAAAATAVSRMMFFGEGDPPAVAARGLELGERAVSLAPELGDAWAALALIEMNKGDAVRCARTLRKGLAHAPNSAMLQGIVGRMFAEVTPLAEAAVRLEISLSLDPSSFPMRAELSRVRALLGDVAGSESVLDPIPTSGAVLLHRARFSLWRRRPIEIPSAEPDTYARVFDHLARTGGLGDAERAFMDARGRGTAGRIRALFCQRNAELFAYLGEVDNVFAALEGAVGADLIDIAWLDGCPLLDPLRGDARFPPVRAVVAERADRIRAALRGGDR